MEQKFAKCDALNLRNAGLTVDAKRNNCSNKNRYSLYEKRTSAVRESCLEGK